jgi:hypothetical protein
LPPKPLVAPDQVHFPPIPGNKYGGVSRPAVRFLRVHNPLHPHDYGEDFRPDQVSGRISVAASGNEAAVCWVEAIT